MYRYCTLSVFQKILSVSVQFTVCTTLIKKDLAVYQKEQLFVKGLPFKPSENLIHIHKDQSEMNVPL